MKSLKKLMTILLSIAIMTTLFIPPAAAAEGADAPAAEAVFVTDGDRLSSIDFSALIQDNTTIHTDNLVLLDENGKIRRHAKFDAQQNGVAVFGVANEDGSFKLWPLDVTAIDNTFCLRPESEVEKLYDDVATFTFAMHDILANVAEAEIRMVSPAITVTKADGELVREMTLDFSAQVYNDTPMYLDCADLSKALTFSVRFSGLLNVAEITLQPTAYDAEAGVLTVSVRNAQGQEGCTLFDCGLTVDDRPLTVYNYRLRAPGGMFFSSRNEKIRSAEISSGGFLSSIEGVPVRICAELSVPSWITALGDKMTERFHCVYAAAPIAIAYLLFRMPVLIRAKFVCLHTLKEYGVTPASVNWVAVLFEAIKSIVL
ncbi:MAG: hypothetical protein IJT41_02725 [Clostridia bacterium]|nr:hypothetical protein [Clostridia bacterium]